MGRKSIRERRLSQLPKNVVEYFQNFDKPFILSIVIQSSLSALQLKILIQMAFYGLKPSTIQEIVNNFDGIHSEINVNKSILNLLDRKVLIQVENNLTINHEFIEWAVT